MTEKLEDILPIMELCNRSKQIVRGIAYAGLGAVAGLVLGLGIGYIWRGSEVSRLENEKNQVIIEHHNYVIKSSTDMINLTIKNTGLNRTVLDRTAEINKLKTQISERKEHISKAENLFSKYGEVNGSLDDEIIKIIETIEKTSSQVQQYAKMINSFEGKFSDMKECKVDGSLADESIAIRERMDSLNTRITELVSSKDSAIQKIMKEKDAEIKKLKQDISDYTSINKNLVKEISDFEIRFSKQSFGIPIKGVFDGSLKDELENLGKIQKRFDELRYTISDFETKFQTVFPEYSSFEKMTDGLLIDEENSLAKIRDELETALNWETEGKQLAETAEGLSKIKTDLENLSKLKIEVKNLESQFQESFSDYSTEVDGSLKEEITALHLGSTAMEKIIHWTMKQKASIENSLD
jgi:hypothetical protein